MEVPRQPVPAAAAFTGEGHIWTVGPGLAHQDHFGYGCRRNPEARLGAISRCRRRRRASMVCFMWNDGSLVLTFHATTSTHAPVVTAITGSPHACPLGRGTRRFPLIIKQVDCLFCTAELIVFCVVPSWQHVYPDLYHCWMGGGRGRVREE